MIGTGKRGFPPAVAVGGAITLAVLLALVPIRPAHAGTDDYRVTGTEWNGLSDLAGLAGAVGVAVVARDVLDWSEVQPGDVLFLIHPRQPLVPAHVAAFVRGGGRLLLADDFGEATEALAKLSILRRPGGGVGARRWHEDNPSLPVATPSMPSHPLALGVGELFTNHPAVFRVGAGPDVVFTFGADEAVVVSGGLGEGRFVALSDPSVLINAMLAFDGNAVFATNLIAHLVPRQASPEAGPAGARLFVLTGEFELRGTPPSVLEAEVPDRQLNHVLSDFGRFLDELNDYVASDGALALVALLLAVLVIAGAGAAVCRPATRLDGAWTRAAGTDARSYEALVERYDDAGAAGSFAYPASVLRDLAIAELARVTGRAEPLALSPIELEHVAAATAGPAAGRLARRLADGVRRLPTRARTVAPWGARRVSEREFTDLHELLVELERQCLRQSPRSEPAPPRLLGSSPGDG